MPDGRPPASKISRRTERKNTAYGSDGRYFCVMKQPLSDNLIFTRKKLFSVFLKRRIVFATAIEKGLFRRKANGGSLFSGTAGIEFRARSKREADLPFALAVGREEGGFSRFLQNAVELF